ncbi:MAG: sulfotransferase family 2 domain-containing protein [Lewinella sp.]
MLSHHHRCIFVHIPKNGGTSIESIVWPDHEAYTTENLWSASVPDPSNRYHSDGLQHLCAKDIKLEVGPSVFRDYFKFSMVRNPWDKAVSQYLFFFRRPDLRDYLGASRGTSFKQYLRLCGQKPHVHWQPQYLFLTDANGEEIVDYVGRFEDYEASVREIVDRINASHNAEVPRLSLEEIPHINAGNRAAYWNYYDDEARDLVAELYREDISRYGYRFDGMAYRQRERQMKFPVDRRPSSAYLYSGLSYLRRKLF